MPATHDSNLDAGGGENVGRPGPQMFRYATWGLGFLLILVVAYAIFTQFREVGQRLALTAEGLADHFAASNLTVAGREQISELQGASKATRIDVSGGKVVIYSFDRADGSVRDEVAEIKQRGMMMVDGTLVPAMVNGPLVMTGHETHPASADLKKAFLSYRVER